jgi:hypothetical protein
LPARWFAFSRAFSHAVGLSLTFLPDLTITLDPEPALDHTAVEASCLPSVQVLLPV